MNSIKAKIAIIIVFVMVALFIVLFFLSKNIYENYKDLQVEQCRAQVALVGEHTNKNIERLEDHARSLALEGELYMQTSRDAAFGEDLVINNFGANQRAAGGGIWFEPYAFDGANKRVCFYAYASEDGAVYDESFRSEEYDYFTQEWYESIRKSIIEEGSDVVWTRPYADEAGTNSVMTTVGCGIFQNGEFVGMSTVDELMDIAIRDVEALKPTKNSFSLFADTKNDYILSLTGTEKNAVGKNLSSLEWTDKIKDGKLLYNRKTYLMFEEELSNGMIIIVGVPEQELFSEIRIALIGMVMLLVFAGLVIVFISYRLLEKFISRPASYLAEKSREIGAGNLDVIVDLHTNDEFAELGESFNRMTTNIKEDIRQIQEITAEKERIGAELSIAAQIQASMLPSVFPPFPERKDLDLYASMAPAKEVGGDFYDFFFVDDDTLAVVIADVSGKGVPAALFMMITKTLIKNYASMKLPPGEVFTQVNAQLCENNDMNMFVTAFMGYWNLKTGRFQYVNAGHNAPCIRRTGNDYEFMKVKPGFVLAGLSEMKYTQEETTLNHGDALYLYTDGVTEMQDMKGHLFGEKALCHVLNERKGGAAKELLSAVTNALMEFAGTAPQADDITQVAITLVDEHASRINVDSPPVSEKKELTIVASVANLRTVLAFIENEIQHSGFAKAENTKPETIKLLTAAEEIFVNIANYAYGENSDSGDVITQVTVSDNPAITEVCFMDYGKKYNPLESGDPDISAPAEMRNPGGLGIFLVKNLVDDVKYEYDAELKANILTLVKHMKS